MPSAGEPTTEKLFKFPENLSHLSINHETFLQRHPNYHQVAIGALVFQEDRLLLVQRSSSERSFPECWEFPGGSVDPEDQTILHAVARELMEEAGLRVISVVHQIGEGVEFRTGSGLRRRTWLKLAFEVIVAGQETRLGAKKEGKDEDDGAARDKSEAVAVKLDPAEHQDYLWVTEDEIKKGESKGIQLAFVSPAQTAVMLEGFRLRREGSK